MHELNRRRPSSWIIVLTVVMVSAAFTASAFAQKLPNLLKNGNFEAAPTSADFGWGGSAPSTPQGSMTASPALTLSGRSRLKLVPTALNVGSTRYGNLFGVGQGILVAGLEGKTLYLSGWLQAEGKSIALLHIYAVWKDGRATLQESRQASSNKPVRRRDVVMVPRDAAYLIVLCVVEGTTGAAYFDDVSLSVGQPLDWPEAIGVSDDTPTMLNATISVNPERKVRHIPPTLFGTNLEWIWDGNGMWDPNTQRLNPSIVSLTRDMGATLHRFPGGIFSDFYNWTDGIGPQSTRRVSESIPGGVVSVHTFGTDEALEFADKTNGKLLLTVNVVTGTPEQAAEWVRYVNKTSRRVEYWEIGNESYVAGDTLPASASVLTPEEYTRRFLLFARAMRAVDPGIKIGAIADENYTRSISPFFANWTEHLLRTAGSEIDFIAVHCGYAPALWEDRGWNPRTVYSAMLAAPQLIRQHLTDLSARIETLAPGRDIKIAVTEWGPFFDASRESRFVDHTKTLGSALFVASTLKTFVESSRTNIANLFKLMDSAYMGWIGLRNGVPVPKATVLALQMFTRYFGTELVESQTISPTYDAPSVGWVDAAHVPYLDVVASTDADGKHIYVIAINKDLDAAVRGRISIPGSHIVPKAQVITLGGTAVDANTGTGLIQVPGFPWAKQAEVQPLSRFYSGSPDEVSLVQSSFNQAGSVFDYTFPPHSVTALVLSIEEPIAQPIQSN